jgi:hypothetical protein
MQARLTLALEADSRLNASHGDRDSVPFELTGVNTDARIAARTSHGPGNDKHLVAELLETSRVSI